MGWGKALLAVALLSVACVDKKGQQPCDPQTDESCNIASAKAGCKSDADCGDGVCQSDGTCKAKDPVTKATACVGVTCPAGNFCSNGVCLPENAQCTQADPACIYVPHGAFEQPAHEWWWPFPTPDGPDGPAGSNLTRSDIEYPDFVQVMSTPVVMRLSAKDASPAVVFNTFSQQTGVNGSQFVEVQGVMRAIRGIDGTSIWSAPHDMWNHMDQSVNGNSGIAAGDCMGTGEVCFITGGWNPIDVPCFSGSQPGTCDPNVQPGHAHEHGGLIAFGSDGRFLWVNRQASIWWGAPAIARLLGPTGPAQVVVGNGVYDAGTGATLCAQTRGAAGGNGDGTLSIVADVDLDGTPEIVTGNQACKLTKDAKSATGYSCKPLYGDGVQMPNGQPCAGGAGSACPDGFPAVANFAGYGATMGLKPDDKHPQVVVVAHGYLRIQDWTGGMLLSPVPLPQFGADCADPSYNPGGAPTIADFDGDGLPEIGVASQSAYSVWKPGVGWVWNTPTFDCSANTGSSVFDFEGKGNATVVYSDQCAFHVYDGKTGKTLITEKNSSCTAYEMPIVADIDGSGRAKILVPNNNVCQYICDWGSQDQHLNVGLKALMSPNDRWVNTRSVWNEHTYHVSNVGLDGSLPYPEPNSWQAPQSNTYRQNVQGQGVFSAPDLSVCEVQVDMAQCATSSATVSAIVYNGGALMAKPGITVDFYAELSNGQEAHIGQGLTTKTLKPGDSEKVGVQWIAPPQNVSSNVKAIIDQQSLIGDCHPENNTAATKSPVKCNPLG
ncbi:MAG: FG-GAP repeat domain-containing protein [Myxococcales bacterium]